MNEVYIERKDFDKIISYAKCAYDKYKSEIGGMAVCIELEDRWIIQDPVILKQEISGGNCELDKTALAKYYTEYGMKYKNTNYRFLWWHSHHTMGAFWSSTDLEAIDEFKEGDLSFALVVNLKREYVMRVSVWKPVEIHKDVTLEVINNSVDKSIEKEVDKLCERETHITRLTNKTRTAYNYYQTNLLNGYSTSEKVDVNHTNEEVIEYMTNKVDDILTEFNSGGINFKKLRTKFNTINKKLKKAKSHYKLKAPLCQTDEILYTGEPHSFINVKDDDSAALMDLQTWVYNNTWGYGV